MKEKDANSEQNEPSEKKLIFNTVKEFLRFIDTNKGEDEYPLFNFDPVKICEYANNNLDVRIAKNYLAYATLKSAEKRNNHRMRWKATGSQKDHSQYTTFVEVTKSLMYEYCNYCTPEEVDAFGHGKHPLTEFLKKEGLLDLWQKESDPNRSKVLHVIFKPVNLGLELYFDTDVVLQKGQWYYLGTKQAIDKNEVDKIFQQLVEKASTKQVKETDREQFERIIEKPQIYLKSGIIDIVRIFEAMKLAEIISTKTQTKQIGQIFFKQSNFSGKYDAAKSRLKNQESRSNSKELVKFVKILCEMSFKEKEPVINELIKYLDDLY